LALEAYFSGVLWATWSLATNKAGVCWRAALERQQHIDVFLRAEARFAGAAS